MTAPVRVVTGKGRRQRGVTPTDKERLAGRYVWTSSGRAFTAEPGATGHVVRLGADDGRLGLTSVEEMRSELRAGLIRRVRS